VVGETDCAATIWFRHVEAVESMQVLKRRSF